MSHFIRVCGFNNVSSIGGGQYTLNLFFSDSTQARFLRINDVIEDNAAVQWVVNTWVGSPSDFVSGNQVTVTEVVVSSPSPSSAGFDCEAFTPGQENFEPAINTSGTIGSISLFSGQNFEYTMQASWNDLSQANKAIVGDSVVDSNGKEYTISFLDVGQFSVPFRVTEVEKVGQTPVAGSASLYRRTGNRGLFQGSSLSSAATDTIRNRDNVILDALVSGGDSNGDFTLYHHVLTVGEISAKEITISPIPLVPSEVIVTVIGAPSPSEYLLDYTIIGATLSWNGLGLDGLLEAGEKILLRYFA